MVWISTTVMLITIGILAFSCLIVGAYCDRKWDEIIGNKTPCDFCIYNNVVSYSCDTCRISDDGFMYRNYIGTKPIEKIGCRRFTNGDKR